MNIKNVILPVLLGTVSLNGQISNEEDLLKQITQPTMGYYEIAEEGNAIFQGTSGPVTSNEKEFRRWDYLANGRMTFPGATKTSNLEDLGAYLGIANSANLFCNSGPASSPWTTAGPNPNPNMVQAAGLLSCVGVHPSNSNIIYVGTASSGLWKTTNGGVSWTNIIDNSSVAGVPSLGYSSISIDPVNPQNILVGTRTSSFGYPDWQQSSYGYGIIKSTDGGVTWSTTNATGANDDYWHVSVIKRHPSNPNTVIAAGNKKIWKSIDGGSNWNVVFNNPTAKAAYFIDVEFSLSSPSTVFASNKLSGWGGNVAQNQNTPASPHASQVFVSTSTGNFGTWNEVTPPNSQSASTWASNIVMDVTPAQSNYLYTLHAMSSTHYVYRTADGGQTWSLASSGVGSLTNNNWGFHRHEFEISDNSASVMYAGTNTLLKSTNSGASWTSKSQYAPATPAQTSTHADVRGIFNLGYHNGNDVLIMVNDGGIAKTSTSANTKTSWANLNGNGLIVAEFFAMDAFRGNERIVGGAIHNGTFLYDGSTWTPFVQFGDGDWSEIDHSSMNEQRCYSIVNGTIYKSDNQGSSYSSLPNQPENQFALGQRLSISPIDHNKIYYAFKNGHIFNSTTQTWTTIFTKEAGDNTGSPASAFKVAPSDENVVYLAFKDVTWADPSNNYKFYKTTNGGSSWTNLTTNLVGSTGMVYNWSYIGDLVIDPKNSNRVFVGIKNYGQDPNNPTQGKDRVMFSANGGSSWSDISTGLPPVPVNYLTYVEGTNDLVFAGTDAGVYYWDASMAQWICFNRNLPNVRISKVEVDPCNEVVYASTLGRGIWKAPMPNIDRDIMISNSQTWSTDKVFNGRVTIGTGTTLTITGNLYMGRKGSIVVKPGAELVLNGGHITTGECSDWWGGIYLSGNSNQPQVESAQGKITIINQGMISNARDGITNIDIDANGGWIWGTTGGIINANGAKFYNNRRDVQLLSYVPPGAKNEKYNASFIDCEFIRNENFEIETMIPSMTMWNVAGVEIRGCQFKNHNNPDWEYEGGAIFTIDASYKVHENQATTAGCQFRGYADAIRSKGDFSVAFPITVVGANFTNNIHGIYLDGVQNAKIAYNNISVKANHGYTPPNGTPFQNRGYGIYLDRSNLFLVHDNQLFNPDGFTLLSAGIVVTSNSGAPDQLYHNSISNFQHGSQAIFVNRSDTDPYKGLTYQCNIMGATGDYNWTDFIVDPYGSIAGFQISENEKAENEFSAYSGTNHFMNHGPIVIYHATGSSLPTNYTGLAFYNKAGSPVPNCNPWPKPSIVVDPGTAIQDIGNIEEQIIQDKYLRTQLIDEGSIPELEAQILFASNQTDYQNLYIDMMHMSPYVSEENLLNLTGLADFPELALRNIMVANPHGSRSPEVWEALLSREPALSQQTLDDIEAEQQTITAKDVLDMQIAGKETESHYLSVQLMQFYAEGLGENASYLQDLKDHLQYRDEVYFRYALVDLYLSEGDVTSAHNILEEIPNECEMGEQEHLEYISMEEFYTTITPFINGEDRLDQLDEPTLATLRNIAEGGAGIAPGKARPLLVLNGVETEYFEPLLDVNGQYKNAVVSNNPNRASEPASGFDLYPNPATDQVVLKWDWLKAGLTEGFEIYVRDMKGALIQQVSVKNHQVNTRILKLNSLTPGIYLLSVENGDDVLHQTKLTIQK